MGLESIDQNSPVPKYHQIKEFLRVLVEDGTLGEGESIPPERLLAERYGVSRLTARQAVGELVNEGLLYRRQGRGTFVASRKVGQEAEHLTSFTEDMRRRGMESSSRVLEIEVEGAGPVTARKLQVVPGDMIIRLTRIRSADGEPMALETSHLVYETTKAILGADLARRSLYEVLSENGIKMSRAEQSYEAVISSDSESEQLGMSPGGPALLIERVTLDERDRPFEYVKSVYRGDRYRITSTLRP